MFSLNSLHAASIELVPSWIVTFSLISVAFQCLPKSESKSDKQVSILILKVFEYSSSITKLQPECGILGKKLSFLFLNLSEGCRSGKLRCLKRAIHFDPNKSSYYPTASKPLLLFQLSSKL